jgi:hypothetical protein
MMMRQVDSLLLTLDLVRGQSRWGVPLFSSRYLPFRIWRESEPDSHPPESSGDDEDISPWENLWIDLGGEG